MNPKTREDYRTEILTPPDIVNLGPLGRPAIVSVGGLVQPNILSVAMSA